MKDAARWCAHSGSSSDYANCTAWTRTGTTCSSTGCLTIRTIVHASSGAHSAAASAYCASKQTSCSPASPTSSTNHKNKAGAPVPARFATERPRLRYSTDCHNFVLPCRHPSFTSGRRTMNAVTSPRARLVDLLWQLKQAYDNGGDQSDVRFIHFNTLLNDDVYRTEIVSRALQSSNRKIRELGQKLRDLNRDGAL